jgi:hypothetical protein
MKGIERMIPGRILKEGKTEEEGVPDVENRGNRR